MRRQAGAQTARICGSQRKNKNGCYSRNRRPLERITVKRPHFAPVALVAVLTLLAGASLPRIAAAQDASSVASPAPAYSAAPHRGGRHHRRGGGWMKSLNLSADQKTQIKSIMQASRSKNQGADPATRRASRQAAMAQVRSVLTPAQQTTFDAHMAQMRAEHESGAK